MARDLRREVRLGHTESARLPQCVMLSERAIEAISEAGSVRFVLGVGRVESLRSGHSLRTLLRTLSRLRHRMFE